MENRLVAARWVGGEEGELGLSGCKLAYTGCTARPYCVAQGTVFNIL